MPEDDILCQILFDEKASLLVGDIPELTPKPEKFPECFRNHPQVCARRLPVASWIMADFHLVNSHPKGHCLSENLGIHHRADGADLHSIKNGALKNLEGTIDVPDFYAENHSDKCLPTPGIDQSVRRILPLGPVPGHDFVMARPLDEVLEFLQDRTGRPNR